MEINAWKIAKVILALMLLNVGICYGGSGENNYESAILEKYRNDRSVNHIVFVKHIEDSDAELKVYQKTGNEWNQLVNCDACVGYNGINKEREGDGCTPTGEFRFTEAFGILPNPGARLPYTEVHENLYWCGDAIGYNKMLDIRESPHKCEGEHLIEYGPAYNYALVINYNFECIMGKGSAIFLHCHTGSGRTAGCISVDESTMRMLVQLLGEDSLVAVYDKEE